MPLERDEEHPHVYWSVPASWPGPRTSGGRLEPEDLAAIARLLARLPRSQDRERVLAKLMGPTFASRAEALPTGDDALLTTIEDGMARRRPLEVIYFSASRGTESARCLSIQRILYGERARAVAYCHESGELKWFRLERIRSARLATEEPYREASDESVLAFVRESMDGFRKGVAQTCEFEIDKSVARWALGSLPVAPDAALITWTPNAANIVLRTAALDVLARYLVGFGENAKVIGPRALREMVVDLGSGAARANLDTVGARLNMSAGSPIRSPSALRIARHGRVHVRLR
ncbi:MAG: WYL domain-containing protein [Polyangiaceae bacterium]